MSASIETTDGREQVAVRAYATWLRRQEANPTQDWLNAEAELHELTDVTRRLHQLEDERRLARQIQQGLLPTSMPNLAGLSIAGRCWPSEMVGGDYFDVFPLPDERLAVVVGDASGHSIGSALTIAGTRAYLRALALTLTNLGEILALTNRRLTEDLKECNFVTLFLAVLDPRTGAMNFAGAGHCPGYLLNAAGQTKAAIYGQGIPLGLEAESAFPVTNDVVLESGDLLFLYTDGIIEAWSTRAGQFFGIERALNIIREHRLETPGVILDWLLLAVTEFSWPAGQADDATAIILKLETPSTAGIHRTTG